MPRFIIVEVMLMKKNGEIELAVKDYTKAIQLKRNYTAAYCNRGVAYGKINKNDLAITDYSMAIQLDPDYAKAYYNRGNAYRRKGEIDKAIEDYSEAINKDPEYTDAYNSRGVIYSIKGKLTEPSKIIIKLYRSILIMPKLITIVETLTPEKVILTMLLKTLVMQ